jgi:hypothetical protein
MAIVFSICSYNYSALAFTLFHSLKEHNPEIKFILGLVDTQENFLMLKEKAPEGFNILLIDGTVVKDYDELQKRYNITELNTAVKPFVFEYLFSIYSDYDHIIYLDPDIMVFHPFKEELLSHFNDYEIILTPHITKPRIEDKIAIIERSSITTGIFNLGFLGLKRSDSVSTLLEWWKLRLRYWGYINIYEGMFTDQIWMNFIPLFYDKVLIFKHPGANVAHWNLLERHFLKINGKYYVNDDKHPLLFYHFSAFTHVAGQVGEERPASVFTGDNDKRQDLVDEIILAYQKKLVSLGHGSFFTQKKAKPTSFSLKNSIKNFFINSLRKNGYEIVKTIKYYKLKKLI